MSDAGRLLVLTVLACAAPAGLRAADPAPASWANDLAPIEGKDWNAHRAAHLLERAGFGCTPGEVARLAKMTPAEAVDSLVEYQKVDDTGWPAFEPSGIYPNGHKLVGLDQVVGVLGVEPSPVGACRAADPWVVGEAARRDCRLAGGSRQAQVPG